MSALTAARRRALGEQLRRVRENSDLSQAELGRLASLSRNDICNIEAGRRGIGARVSAKLTIPSVWIEGIGMHFWRWNSVTNLEIGSALRALRLEKKLSMQELADGVGCSVTPRSPSRE